MDPRLEALEAAKVAAMVSAQLKTVDGLTIDRRERPANKINLQGFVDAVKDPRNQTPNAFREVPAGFAPPPSEDFIRNSVPDPVFTFPQPEPSGGYTPNVPPNLPPLPQAPVGGNGASQPNEMPGIRPPVGVFPPQLDTTPYKPSVLASEKIENALERIGNALEALVELEKQKLNEGRTDSTDSTDIT